MPRLAYVLAVLSGAAFAADAPDLDAINEQIDAVRLDFDQAVEAAGLHLPLDYGSLRLERGVLVPAIIPGDERLMELVFLGSGRLTIDIPDEIEAQQLVLFTGEDSLDVRLEWAVLIQGDGKLVERVTSQPSAPVDPETRDRATRLFEEWTVDAEREGFGARDAMIRALAGDVAGAEFFGLWFMSKDLGRAFYAVNPTLKEPVVLGAFELFEDKDFQSRRVQKLLRRAEKARKKREKSSTSQASGVTPDEEEDQPCGANVRGEATGGSGESDDDTWEWIKTWVSAARAGADPRNEPPGIEPEHYEIELTLSGDDLEAEGLARIELQANVDGLTLAELFVGDELEICDVVDNEQRSLPFHQRDLQVFVGLPQPTVAGESFELAVRFAGKPVRHWLARRTLQRTILWHPHAGRLDRATYDVTLRWPEEHSLLASGQPVGGGVENGQRWTRRTLAVPTAGFSFEIGDYDVVEDYIGHVNLMFGFHRRDTEMTDEKRAEIVRTAKAALLFYETQLGLLPIDHLVITTARRGFSQGLLGFVTLAEGAVHAGRANPEDNRTEQEVRLETIAHEISHQWWGHVVGWESYRDQWLSEGLADFSASTFMGKIAENPADYLERHAALWRTELQSTNLGEQLVGSLGPVVLGRRLYRNHGSAAYQAVIYSKGAAVFSTLAQRLGPEPLWQMLGEVCKAVNNRVIRTSTFFSALERMSGQNLGEFVDQYVHGSGMPVLFYEYRPARGEGGWVVEGQVLQLPGQNPRYVLKSVERGWDVVRRNIGEDDVTAWSNVLPFRVDTASEQVGETNRGFQGNIFVQGESSSFVIPVDDRPVDFRLDPYGQILAELHAERFEPKRHLLRLGEHLVRIGRPEQARTTLQSALEARMSTAEADSDRSIDAPARLVELNASIHLGLARLALDAGDGATARQELRATERLLRDNDDYYRGERTVLATRLDLQRGLFDAALARLDDYLSHYGLELEVVWADRLLDDSKSSALRISRGEMLALYAAAAYEHQSKDAALLARMATLAGVDMRALGLPNASR